MQPQLIVDEKNNLVEARPLRKKQPTSVRIIAKIISYIFHPLFIPIYLCWLTMQTQSHLFGVFTRWEKTIFIIRFAVIYIMFPLVSVLLLRAVGFVSSLYLTTQKDRIIPYIVSMIWYWWMWYVLHNQPEYPKEFVILSLAIFLACVGGSMANISIKISMHAISAGVMAAFVMLLALSQDINFGVYVSIAVLLTGITCTARFIDSDHTAKEIYLGLLIGIGSLLLAVRFA